MLIAGGAGHLGFVATAELYDPAAGTFSATGSMTAARDGHSATVLEERLRRYVQQTLEVSEEAAALPVEILRRGEITRGEAPRVIGRPERTARAVLSKLVDAGLLLSDTPKGKVKLHVSVDSADVLFPRLFGTQLSGS